MVFFVWITPKNGRNFTGSTITCGKIRLHCLLGDSCKTSQLHPEEALRIFHELVLHFCWSRPWRCKEDETNMWVEACFMGQIIECLAIKSPTSMQVEFDDQFTQKWPTKTMSSRNSHFCRDSSVADGWGLPPKVLNAALKLTICQLGPSFDVMIQLENGFANVAQIRMQFTLSQIPWLTGWTRKRSGFK